MAAYLQNDASKYMEIFLPWRTFNNRSYRNKGYYALDYLDHKEEAAVLAELVHPAWHNCKDSVRKLHTRNIFQVFGFDMNTLSSFVICYAKPKGTNGEVQGGTGTAVKLALDNNIRVYNLYYEETVALIENWLK